MAKKQYIGALGGRLPAGYMQVEYLQSSGTQYIDTGFTPNQDTRFVATIEHTAVAGPAYLFGARPHSSATKTFGLMCTGSKYRADYAANRVSFSLTGGITRDMVVDENKNAFILGSETITATYTSFTAPATMAIFGMNEETGFIYPSSMKFYGGQLYDNGTLVRDFVPAVNSVGIAGLYDLKNGFFYTNAGTGTFTTGGAVQVEAVEAARLVKGAYFGVEDVARKIKKAYIGDENGIARMFLGDVDVAAMAIGYTGAYTDQLEVTMSGKKYRLLTLTGSGTLTVDAKVRADVWMIGGGNNGGPGYQGNSYGGCGGAGGYSEYAKDATLNGSIVASVAAAAGATSLGNISTKVVSYNSGGTGGGRGSGERNSTSNKADGTGDGKSKYPFEDSAAFPYPHGGGGGSGGRYTGSSMSRQRGYDGGTNGGSAPGTRSGSGTYDGGIGGNRGGGSGVKGSGQPGSGNHATYYGAGGGGGGAGKSANDSSYGANGYQGVIYVRIPYEQ